MQASNPGRTSQGQSPKPQTPEWPQTKVHMEGSSEMAQGVTPKVFQGMGISSFAHAFESGLPFPNLWPSREPPPWVVGPPLPAWLARSLHHTPARRAPPDHHLTPLITLCFLSCYIFHQYLFAVQLFNIQLLICFFLPLSLKNKPPRAGLVLFTAVSHLEESPPITGSI